MECGTTTLDSAPDHFHFTYTASQNSGPRGEPDGSWGDQDSICRRSTASLFFRRVQMAGSKPYQWVRVCDVYNLLRWSLYNPVLLPSAPWCDAVTAARARSTPSCCPHTAAPSAAGRPGHSTHMPLLWWDASVAPCAGLAGEVRRRAQQWQRRQPPHRLRTSRRRTPTTAARCCCRWSQLRRQAQGLVRGSWQACWQLLRSRAASCTARQSAAGGARGVWGCCGAAQLRVCVCVCMVCSLTRCRPVLPAATSSRTSTPLPWRSWTPKSLQQHARGAARRGVHACRRGGGGGGGRLCGVGGASTAVCCVCASPCLAHTRARSHNAAGPTTGWTLMRWSCPATTHCGHASR
jgi:hypothetical protein